MEERRKGRVFMRKGRGCGEVLCVLGGGVSGWGVVWGFIVFFGLKGLGFWVEKGGRMWVEGNGRRLGV